MQRIGLFVQDDIHRPIEVGGTYTIRWGRYKILDLEYTNQYGTFIRGELVPDEDEAGVNRRWENEWGPGCHPDNPIEIVNTLYIPESVGSGGIQVGFLFRDTLSSHTIAGTQEEAWSAVFSDGATNAYARVSRLDQFTSRLLDSCEELPSFDSYYWRHMIAEGSIASEVVWSPKLLKHMERMRRRF